MTMLSLAPPELSLAPPELSLAPPESEVTHERTACPYSNNYRGAFRLRGAFWGLWCTKVSREPESSPVANTRATWYDHRDEKARAPGHVDLRLPGRRGSRS